MNNMKEVIAVGKSKKDGHVGLILRTTLKDAQEEANKYAEEFELIAYIAVGSNKPILDLVFEVIGEEKWRTKQ